MKKLIFLIFILVAISCAQTPVLIEGTVLNKRKVPLKFAELLLIEQTPEDTIKVHDFFSDMLAYRIRKAEYLSVYLTDSEETVTLKQKLEEVDSLVAFKYIKLKSYASIKTISDKDGNFSLSVNPGKYFVITTDKSNYDITYLECNGLVNVTPLTVSKENNEKLIVEF